MKSLLHTILVGLLIVVFIGYACKKESEPQKTVTVIRPTPMSVKDLQRFLNSKNHPRYKCKIDGRYGTETNTALENFLCDEEYKKELERCRN